VLFVEFVEGLLDVVDSIEGDGLTINFPIFLALVGKVFLQVLYEG
jgi:hypothetical protein